MTPVALGQFQRWVRTRTFDYPIYIYIYIYQHPPTGHQLRPVRVQQPSTNSLLEGADIYTPGDGSDSFRSRNSLPLLVELAFLLGPLGLGG